MKQKWSNYRRICRDSFPELSADDLTLAVREEIFNLSARLEEADYALKARGDYECADAMRCAERILCKAFSLIDDVREDLGFPYPCGKS